MERERREKREREENRSTEVGVYSRQPASQTISRIYIYIYTSTAAHFSFSSGKP